MPVRSVKAQHVRDRFSACRVDDLANSEQRFPARKLEELGDPVVRVRGVDFLIRVTESNFAVAFQKSE